MKKINYNIYDCEFGLYHKGIIIGDAVYTLDKKGNKQDLYIDQKIYIKDGAVSKYEKTKD